MNLERSYDEKMSGSIIVGQGYIKFQNSLIFKTHFIKSGYYILFFCLT